MTRNNKEIPQGTDKKRARKQLLKTVFRLVFQLVKLFKKK